MDVLLVAVDFINRDDKKASREKNKTHVKLQKNTALIKVQSHKITIIKQNSN